MKTIASLACAFCLLSGTVHAQLPGFPLPGPPQPIQRPFAMPGYPLPSPYPEYISPLVFLPVPVPTRTECMTIGAFTFCETR